MNLKLTKPNKENVKVNDLIKPLIGKETYKVTAVLESGVFAHTLDDDEFPHIQRLDFDMFEIIK